MALRLLTVLLLFGCSLSLPACRYDTEPAQSDNTLRIVSLAPNLTEIVCLIGAETLLVGRTAACDYPPRILDRVPPLGPFGNPSLELLVEARPTLLLEVDLEDKTVRHRIDDLGISRHTVSCMSLDDIPKAIRTIGRLVNHARSAEAEASKIEGAIRQLRLDSRTITNRPSVFVELWDEPLTTAGRRSFVSEIVFLAGGRNMGDEIEKDYFVTSPEWVIANNPDAILVLHSGIKGSSENRIMHRPGWKSVSALRSRRVYDSLDSDLVLRPGPRALDGIRELRRLLQTSEVRQRDNNN